MSKFEKIVSRIKYYLIKLQIVFRIFFKEKHIVCLYITRDDLKYLISDNNVKKITASYIGLRKHQMDQIIKIAAESTDDISVICDKAVFEAEVEENLNKYRI